LDRPGLELWQRKDIFSSPTGPRPDLGHTPYTWGSFPAVIWPGREADHVPPSRAEVKNEVAIHLPPI
jgi:hypothetical protein